MKIRYRDLRAYKYELGETYSLDTAITPAGAMGIHTQYLSLTASGYLTIIRAYAWDGPSGPAIDTPNFMRGSLVHDAIYQLIRMGLLPMDRRAQADALLRKLCLEDGMSSLRAASVYAAVRAFGGFSCKPRPEDRAKLKDAP